MLAAVVFALVALAADPAPSPPAASTAPQPAATAGVGSSAPDKTRLVCKRETAPNSRLSKRVCMTVAEWDERAETSRGAVQEIQNRPRTN